MSTYWELLRDPRWQRKRLEVMQCANFACEECTTTEETLNVHHTYYSKGKKPWEYPTEALRCLCQGCHQETESVLAEVRELIGKMDITDLAVVRGFLLGAAAMKADQDTEIVVDSVYVAYGLACAFGVMPRDVEGKKRNLPYVVRSSYLDSVGELRRNQMRAADAAGNE